MTAQTSPPLVSVVMPVYNHRRYLAEAVASVFSQTWRPLELIIIDDGSTDDSAACLRAYLDATPTPEGKTVRFTSRPNRGAHATINEGLSAARGEYIAVLNSDDAYLPERLEQCLEMARNQNARMVLTYVDPIDDDGNSLPQGHPWRSWYADVLLDELDIAPSLSTCLLKYNIGISTGNLFFHRSLINDVGPFADFRYAHDIDFLLRVSLIEEPVILRRKLYRYRVHASNTIAESNEKVTAEYAEIVRRYFVRALAEPPANPMAPSLDTWAFTLAAGHWPEHLWQGIDGLLSVTAPRGSGPALPAPPPPGKSPVNGPRVTLLTHELSYTGAPVLLRDIAAALHRHGVATRLITLAPGPLGADFEQMDSPVEMGSRILSGGRAARFLSRVGNWLFQTGQHPRMPRLAAWMLRRGAWLAGGTGNRFRIWGHRRMARGTLLINSFASWPLALALLEHWRGHAFWYIHETYDPGLFMRSDDMHARLRALVESDRVRLLFGSDATRAVWAAAGYDGQVCYWSGLPRVVTPPLLEHHGARSRMILSVQSTGTRKGTHALLEAFALARVKGWIDPDVELRIIGCHLPSVNALSRDLLRRVHKPDLHGAVSLVPSQKPGMLERHYRDATLYVQSSIMECLPLALLTAMAHGLPIVSTDADGCREAILDGQTGRLVPQRHSESMARALADLLADRATAQTLGNAARARFNDLFALEATVPHLLDNLLRHATEPRHSSA